MTGPIASPRDPGCIFCRIVAGEIPCHKLYEDDLVLGLLDIGPIARGHCLVIPKGHWVTLDEVPDEAAAACGRVLPRLGRAVMAALYGGAGAWNVLQNNGKAAGQAVGHVHFHIIPKADQGANATGCAPGSGLRFAWPAGQLADAEAVALREAITAALAGEK
jgi:histidine triad (HIT) family protein